MADRKIKSMSFNLEDPYEKRMFEHAGQYKSFATYVKRLIQRDMEGGQGTVPQGQVNQEEPKEKEPDRNIASSFL